MSRCKFHEDCFTCPFDDCKFGKEDNEKSAQKKEKMRNYKREMQKKYRANSLKNEFPNINFNH